LGLYVLSEGVEDSSMDLPFAKGVSLSLSAPKGMDPLAHPDPSGGWASS
jgi:hypothetical protein